MNWDDLRIAREVYRTGSYAAAGARLRINETTVARRLARLQQDLGRTLFEAVDGVRKPTAACEDLVAVTAAMANHAERIAKIGDQDVGLVGRRRIATTDSLATDLLAPRLGSLLTEHPGLAIDFLASTENVNFSRWEADVAVRYQQPDKGDFVISKLADMTFYLFEPKSPDADDRNLVVAYPPDLDGTPESKYLMSIGLYQRARCTTKNQLLVKQLIQSAGFSGVLASYMCGGLLDDPTLRVTKLPHCRGVWLLVQPHLKNDAATRTVIDWIRDCFRTIA